MSQEASTRPIRFVHCGQVVQVSHVAPTTTVLSWLREHAGCTGTKEGCNEGDCGACTVQVGSLVPGPAGPRVDFKPLNSCIQFLPTLDGKALRTVEDLGGQHPAQQAMVECHGSQCGFCTPGFVMSLVACYDQHQAAGTRPTRQALADDLSGNLCRCTGYRPILAAGLRMFDLDPPVAVGDGATLAALQSLVADAPLYYAAGHGFHAPSTLDELATLRAELPQARLLAGGTDVGLWVNKQFRDLGEVIYLGQVDELKAITVADGELRIAAGASLHAAWAALACHWPETLEMGLRFASLPIRHAGTLGGNIANGSPIGDGAPVLMALGARIVLRHGATQREFPLDDFYVGYMQNRLAPGEFVEALCLPLPKPDEVLRVYKLSKRYDSDISGLACGLMLQVDGDIVIDARFAFGGMAATVSRARRAEAAVRGQHWTEATLHAAMSALGQDFNPLTDLRASDAYRRTAAANLLKRFWLETRVANPLPTSATRVWPVRVGATP